MGLVISMWGQSVDLLSIWPLGALILWNMIMTMLASLSVRISYHRIVSALIDTALCGVFFFMQGGMNSPARWVGVLPILTNSVYFEFLGGLITAVLFAALFAITSPFDGNVTLQLSIPVYAAGGSLLILGLLFGFIGHQLASRMKYKRSQQQDGEDKKHRIENDRLRALYDLTSTLATTLNYKRVLDSALNMGYTVLNPESGDRPDERLVGAMLLFQDGVLNTGSSRKFTNADLRVTFNGAEGILKKVFEEGDPVHTKNIGYDPEFNRVIALRNCTSAYCFPLRSGLDLFGAMLFAHPDPEYFTEDRRDLLDIIGRQAIVAIQNALLYQNIAQEKERVTEVHEEARKKLARDLHDGPTQSVAAMAMRVNLAKRMVTKDPNAAVEELAKIEELAHRTTKEIRHMLFTLRPLVLESQGLEAALKQTADKMKETYSQNVTVSVDEAAASQLEMGKQGVIFYIAEEAVNNARKHAQAPVIAITLRQVQEGILMLEIADNGVGFDVKAMSEAYDKRANSSLGMVNLRERTELVNGILRVDSAPGKGTRIQVFIPITEEAADRLHHARK